MSKKKLEYQQTYHKGTTMAFPGQLVKNVKNCDYIEMHKATRYDDGSESVTVTIHSKKPAPETKLKPNKSKAS